jgi:uncharacterized protein involved in cysteine biosynthesis
MGLNLVTIAVSQAIGQVFDPAFRMVLFKGVGLAIAALAALIYILGLVFGGFIDGPTALPLIGAVDFSSLLSWAGIISGIVLSVFLMVPVASLMSSFFLDDVAQAVEDKHYPHVPQASNTPIGEQLKDTLGFFGVLIAANITAFLISLILIPFAPVIFALTNGFLLGREYFQLVAMRHTNRTGAKSLRRKHLVTIWTLGTIMAIPLVVPIANLFVPILGAAAFTHLFHMLNQGQNA